MWGLGRPIGLLLVVGLVCMAVWLTVTHWRPSAASYPLQGIDLGLNPGQVEWGSVRAAGADFAYLTATAGAREREPSFEANWAALPEAGLRRGAVHLFSLCQSAEDQANAFNTVVPRTDDALPAAVDISFRDDCEEQPDAAVVTDNVRRFIRIVETHTGKPVLLRVSRRAEATYHLTGAIDRPIWAIGNLIAPRYPVRPWRIWRASDWRHVQGAEQPMNWDVVAS